MLGREESACVRRGVHGEGGDSYVYDGECCTGGGRVNIIGSAFGKGGECMYMTGNAYGRE